MMIKDQNNHIYKVGLKLDYTPKMLKFDPEIPGETITKMGCGRRHYVLLNENNKLLVWGSVFKEKPVKEIDGFGLHFGDQLFEGKKVKDLSVKYSIYGALVEN